MMDEILNYLIANGHITQEAFDEAVAAKQKELADNPPPFVADVQAKASELDDRTLGMQSIDFFTLDQTTQLDDRTVGMQEIDSYSLDLIFEMKAKIEELENRIITLEGGA
jgi:hypothetical protein